MTQRSTGRDWKPSVCAKFLTNYGLTNNIHRPMGNLSLCSRFPTDSIDRKPLLFCIVSLPALLIFPSKPELSLCCIDAEGNTWLLKEKKEQKHIGKYPLNVSFQYHRISGCFILQTYNFDFFTRAFWVLQMYWATGKQLWPSHGVYFQGLQTIADCWPCLFSRCMKTTFRVVSKFRCWHKVQSTAFLL